MQLRIMTYNILDGGIGREALILEVLEAVQPDVVVFEEVYYSETIAGFAKALGADYFFGEGNRMRRVAVLSRVPILSRNSPHTFPPICRNLAQVTRQYQPGQRLHLFV